MIQTFKHIKKDCEIFWGLSLVTIIKLTLLVLTLIYVSLTLRLALNSPLLIFLSTLVTIYAALSIKASQEPEIKNHYSSFLLHPFRNHLFTLNKNPQGYKSIRDFIKLESIKDSYLLNEDGDLISAIEIDQGLILNKLDSGDIECTLKNWENILATISEIKNIKSYFFSEKNYGDILEIFIDIDSYKYSEITKTQTTANQNYDHYSKHHQDWFKTITNNQDFIPEARFYIILKQKNSRNNLPPIIKTLQKIFLSSKTKVNQESIEAEVNNYYLLKEKIKTIENFLTQSNLETKLLEKQELKDFCHRWINQDYFEDSSEKAQQDFILKDKSKFLEHFSETDQRSFITKTYRMISPPESGDLNFWLYEFVKRTNCKSIISLQLITRNAFQDRLKTEQKSLVTKQLSSISKQSSAAIIKENEIASSKLLEKTISFDINLFITVFVDNENQLQEIDNKILSPIKYSKLHSLDREQIPNYFYSLPFAINNLSDKEKHFACLDFAKSCFPFISEQIGTSEGIFIGISTNNKKPVFLNEYNRNECNNRNFNFIGDSGSGKTVLAKLQVLRSFTNLDKFFYIIDSTEDGWKFFIDYLGGQVIEIDKLNLKHGESLFALFEYQSSKEYDFNQHLEDLILFLKILKNSDQEFSAREKNFLISSLKNLYQANRQPCMSDLYRFWQNQNNSENQDLSNDWKEIISPFCYVTNGIYASLIDSNESKINGRLILFTFSKICNDEAFIKASIFLLINFISKKIIFQKQNQTTLIIDEAWKFFVNSKSNHAKEFITHLARAGRGLDLGLWNISQKPSDLPAEIHSNSSCSFIFQLKEAKDRYDIGRFANLKEKELELINSSKLNNSGTMFLKTTRSSGFVEVKLDAVENILCNSTRDFSKRRNEYFSEYLENLTTEAASLLTVKKMQENNV